MPAKRALLKKEEMQKAKASSDVEVSHRKSSSTPKLAQNGGRKEEA